MTETLKVLQKACKGGWLDCAAFDGLKSIYERVFSWI